MVADVVHFVLNQCHNDSPCLCMYRPSIRASQWRCHAAARGVFTEEPRVAGDEDEDHSHVSNNEKKAATKAPPPQECKIGIIVVDHGSRRQEANKALNKVR